MESTFVWTGFWTSVAVGLVLLAPTVVEFFKRNLPVLIGLVVILAALQSLAAASPEIRAVWMPISHLPMVVLEHLQGVGS